MGLMRPIFTVTANGSDISAIVKKHLQSLTITDAAGINSDTLDLILNDPLQEIALPSKGAELRVSLGWEDEQIHPLGIFTVDEVTVSGVPDVITIRAKAANFGSNIKSPTTKSWHQVTFGDIVTSIAVKHQLQPIITDSLAAINVSHLDQTDESDLHFLTRLAKQYNAVAKPAAGKLIVAEKGKTKSATGKALTPIVVDIKQCTRYKFTLADRGKYQAVKTKWHNRDTGEEETITVGTGEPVYTLRRKHTNADEARLAANAKLQAFARGTGTGRLTVAKGNPQAAAEAPANLTGFRPQINGEWVMAKVTHGVTNKGYTNKIDVELT